MKRILLLLFIASCWSCKKDKNNPVPIDHEESKPHTLMLFWGDNNTNDATIKADNKEEVIIKCIVKDKAGKEIPAEIKVTLNLQTFTGGSFRTSKPGYYMFQAFVGSISSNKFIIQAVEDEDKPFKIELTTEKSILKGWTIIRAYNTDEAVFKTIVTNSKGKVLDQKTSLTLNGNPFTGTSFKTDVPGDYKFQASIGDVKSDIHTVGAREEAEKYVIIESSSISSVNSVGRVAVNIKFKNISNKRLKYVTFSVSCYNAVNDVIREEIDGRSTTTFNATGFWEPNSTNSPSYYVGYFTGTKSVKTTLYSVTLEDGKNIFATNR